MSYTVTVWEYPVPRRRDVDAVLKHLEDYRVPQNPRFIQFARALTARYSDQNPEDNEESNVWVDFPMDGKGEDPIWNIGIRFSKAEEVFPFLVDTAQAMRLCVHDFQSGDVYIPKPWWWAPDFYQHEEVQTGMPRGLDLPLIEQVIADRLQPCLAKAGFQHVGYQFVRPIEDGWQCVRYGLNRLGDNQVGLKVFFGVHLRPLIDALLAIKSEFGPNEAWGGWGFFLEDLSINRDGTWPVLPVRSLVELNQTLQSYLPLISGKGLAMLDRVRTLHGLDKMVSDQIAPGGQRIGGMVVSMRILIALLARPDRLRALEEVYARQGRAPDAAEANEVKSVFKYIRELFPDTGLIGSGRH